MPKSNDTGYTLNGDTAVFELKFDVTDNHDKDLLRQLGKQASPQQYLKRLIQEDIGKQAGIKEAASGKDSDKTAPQNTDTDKAEQSFDATLELLKKIIAH